MRSARPIRTVWGPGRTRGETIVCVTGSALVMALLVAYIAGEGGWHDRTVLQTVVLGAVIFDLIFGMFAVSTATANAWYHRAGVGARRFRFAFASAHLCYLVAGAALFESARTARWRVGLVVLLMPLMPLLGPSGFSGYVQLYEHIVGGPVYRAFLSEWASPLTSSGWLAILPGSHSSPGRRASSGRRSSSAFARGSRR